MGLLKLALAVLPFLKEIFLGNKEVNGLVEKNKTVTGLMLVNIILFILYLYAFNEARSKDFFIAESVQRNERLKEQIVLNDDYYRKRLEDQAAVFNERMQFKEYEIAHYKERLEEAYKKNEGDGAK